MSEDYVREKFEQAINALAIGIGPIQERVEHAVLAVLMLRPDHFVDEWSRGEFAKLMYLATDQEARATEGNLQATVAQLSDESAQDLARVIVDIDGHYRRSITDPLD